MESLGSAQINFIQIILFNFTFHWCITVPLLHILLFHATSLTLGIKVTFSKAESPSGQQFSAHFKAISLPKTICLPIFTCDCSHWSSHIIFWPHRLVFPGSYSIEGGLKRRLICPQISPADSVFYVQKLSGLLGSVLAFMIPMWVCISATFSYVGLCNYGSNGHIMIRFFLKFSAEFKIPLVLLGVHLFYYNGFGFSLFQCGNVGFGKADGIAKKTNRAN